MLDQYRFLELVTLGVYLAALIAIGIYSVRQARTSIDYTLAGRSVPWFVVLATTAATMVGGGMSIGFVSRVYEVGIAGAFVTVGAYLGLMFTGLFIAPKLRRLNLITIGDYFELKFGILARLLSVLMVIVSMFAAIVAQMVAMGTITQRILGLDYHVALAVGAAVTIFYSTAGGIRAVIKTDILQFIILVGGFTVACGILMAKQGGFASLIQQVGADHFSLTSQWSAMRVVTFSLGIFLGESLAAPFVSRCFIAKDAQGAKWGVTGAGIFLLLFLPAATFILGTAALANPVVNEAVDAANGNAQLAFPVLMRTAFHPAFAGVMIAAIIAAVMSSADSCLSCLATVAMEDVYRQINPQASDHRLLRVAQWTTLIVGVATASCAYFYRDIVGIIEFVYDFWGSTMVLPFLVGTFFYKREWIYATVCSMVAALMATLCWRFVLKIPGDFSPALFGFAVAVATLLASFPLTRHLALGKLFMPRRS